MAEAGIVHTIGPAVVLLASAVVAVPLFRKLGLGSVLGYFTGGLLVGPSVFGIFTEPSTILHISELGVVMFLFLIGVEMRPQKLWALRAQIFGLGVAQVALCIALLTGAGVVLGLSLVTAFIAGAGFVLSSTAVIMSILKERGELAGGQGQQAVSILLLEDLMIVPLLAIVAFMNAAAAGEAGNGLGLADMAIALGVIALVIAVGRWLLDPFFAMLAWSRTTEVLTAGALLVVLGSALLMEAGGLSMAMGAFLAGMMLSGSSYRHQIETDVEPFKGLLMGLFFLAVGMSLDLSVVVAEWRAVLGLLAAFVIVKSIGIYAVARAFGATNLQALRRMTLFAQGGEFAFVLYAAASGGVITADENAVFSSIIILSMATTPLILILAERFLKAEAVSMDGVEAAADLKGRTLLIGFGRFGQIASQLLLAQGVEVALIDNDPHRIREAERFGFKVYYGDGTRLDVLRQSGAGAADIVMVCVDERKTADRIVELVKAHFPSCRLLARAYDRGHVIALRKAGVDYEIRETFESALAFGGAGLSALGMTALDIDEVIADIRRRDTKRLEVQVQSGLFAGGDRLLVAPRPEPLIVPRGRTADARAEDGEAVRS